MSARSIVDALDRERYEPVLIGIDHGGRWHFDGAGRALLAVGPGEPLLLDTSAPEVAVTPGGGSELMQVDAAPEIDVVFPVLHGSYGEDGTVQGLLDMAGVAYVGAGVLGSAVAMDKDVAKRLLRDGGVPVVEAIVARIGDDRGRLRPRVEAELGWPCFVKPANCGSSLGVHKVACAADLGPALADAFRYDRKVLIERAIDAREIECAVLGNDVPQTSIPGEIVPTHDFYSYQAKYIDENGAALVIPAPLSSAEVARVQELSLAAFSILELSGMARVDFLLDKQTGELYLNEVNTIPGFTKISMYPKLWEASGVAYAELVTRLIDLALERQQQRSELSTKYLPGE